MSETGNSAQEIFSSDVSRMFRRSEISRIGPKTKHVRDDVRDIEKGNRPDLLGEDLILQDFFVSIKDRQISEELCIELNEKFPEVKAVVLMGSNANGGKEVRTVFGTQKYADFDCGIIYDLSQVDGHLSNDRRQLINIETRLLLKKKGVDLCTYANPEHNSMPALSSESALIALKSFAGDNLSTKEKNLLYFLPSFPAEVNKKNMDRIVESLEKISVEDHDLWKKMVDEIFVQWGDVHRLSKKNIHFEDPDKMSQRSIDLSSKIATESKDLMSSNLKVLLLKTDITSR